MKGLKGSVIPKSENVNDCKETRTRRRGKWHSLLLAA